MKQKNKSMMIKEILNFGMMENLHQEIKLDIISRLPVESVLNCRLVCKTWRDLIRFPYFAGMHLRHQLMRLEYRNHSHGSPTPAAAAAAASDDNLGFLLLTMERRSRIFYLEYDENEKHYKKVRRINHPSLCKQCNRSALVGSCNGLVCLSKQYGTWDPAYICNFITKEYINLPSYTSDEYEGIDIFKLQFGNPIGMVGGFGYNHSTSEYKVVRIIYYNTVDEPIIGRVQVYTIGDGNGWRKKGEINYKLIPSIVLPTAMRGILANGALHWLDYEDWKIVVFDLETEEFSLLPSPPCFHPGESHCFQLLVLGGCLCVTTVDNDYGRLNIWSFKKNSCEWESMFSIPNDRNRLAKDVYWPLALTMKGEFLLRWGSFLRYDPKTETIDELVERIEDLGTELQLFEVIPHTNSFVSLRALGEIPHIIGGKEKNLIS